MASHRLIHFRHQDSATQEFKLLFRHAVHALANTPDCKEGKSSEKSAFVYAHFSKHFPYWRSCTAGETIGPERSPIGTVAVAAARYVGPGKIH